MSHQVFLHHSLYIHVPQGAARSAYGKAVPSAVKQGIFVFWDPRQCGDYFILGFNVDSMSHFEWLGTFKWDIYCWKEANESF
jgi:hypothetical protein